MFRSKYVFGTFMVAILITVSVYTSNAFSANDSAAEKEKMILNHYGDNAIKLPSTIKYVGITDVRFDSADVNDGDSYVYLVEIGDNGQDKPLQHVVEAHSTLDISILKETKEVAMYTVSDDDGSLEANYLVVEGKLFTYKSSLTLEF